MASLLLPQAQREVESAPPAPAARSNARQASLPPGKVERPTHCQHAACGKKLKTSGIGRAKRFCNAQCRTAAGRADDEEHGAATVTSTPAPSLAVAARHGKLVLPQIPPPRPAPVSDALPPRTPQDLPTQRGYDSTKTVVEVRGGGLIAWWRS